MYYCIDKLMDLRSELLNFNYREIEIEPRNVFPKINMDLLRERFSYLKKADPHETIFNVLKALAHGGYEYVINEYGFWDSNEQVFLWQNHQCAAIFGVVLRALGFEVSYLEAQRIREHFSKTGMIETISPGRDDGTRKQEFILLRRIPYCCLEVSIRGQAFYISPKDLAFEGGSTRALLTPFCYRNFLGIFRHQSDSSKSGVYLSPVIPEFNIAKANFSRRIVWMKQNERDSEPELFCTFLRMKIIE